MRLELDRTDELAVSASAAAAALRDPATLAAALPGEAAVTVTGPGQATVLLTTGLAGTRGTYRARVHVLGRAEARWQLRVAAAGEPGTAELDLEVELHARDERSCALTHRGELRVEGRLGGVGRAVLTGAIDAAASTFATRLAEVVRAASTEPAPAEPAPVQPGLAASAPAERGSRPAILALAGGLIAAALVVVVRRRRTRDQEADR